MRLLASLLLFLTLSLTPLHATESPLFEGFSLLEKGSSKAAFTVFSSIAPKNSSVHAGMGMAKYMDKDYSSAASHLKKALKSPAERKNWVTNYFAGLACLELGDYKNAVRYLRTASKIKDLPEITLYLGRSKLLSGELNEAEKLFGRAVEKDPKLLEAYLELLKIYEAKKQFETSFKLIEQAKSHVGDDPQLIYQSAKLHFILGKMDVAERELNIAMKKASTKEMQELYASVKKNKTPLTLPPNADKRPDEGILKKYRLVFMAGFFLLCMAAIAFYKTSKDAGKEKCGYINELLKKGDIDGAGEMLQELAGAKGLGDLAAIVKAKFYGMKGDFEKAWELSGTITNTELKLLLQGLTLLVFEKKAELEGHLVMMENSGSSVNIEALKKQAFGSREEAVKALLEL